MKRFILGCLILAMILLMGNTLPASAENTQKLSDLSGEECVMFLQENGVEIPVAFDTGIDWNEFSKAIITAIESNPNVTFPFGYAVLSRFVENVRTVVNEFYGVETVKTVVNNHYGVEYTASLQTQELTSLRDSEPYCEWSDSFKKYNCYAYAIDRYDSVIEPEDDFSIDPGELRGEGINNDTAISDIAQSVQLDLEWLGYTVLANSTTCPVVEVSDHTKLICVRKDVDGYYIPFTDNEGNIIAIILLKDYHFMRLSEDGNWYHKAGKTNPLRYKYTPTNSRKWINEGRDENGLFQNEDWTYDSEIYYIAYSTPHMWENTTSNNNGKHTLTCSICEDTMQEDCDMDYTCVNHYYHKGTCADCGYTISKEPCKYTYVGNGSGQHTATCSVCGGSAQFGCSLSYTYSSSNRHRATCSVCKKSFYKNCVIGYTYTGDKDTNHTHAGGCVDCGHTTTNSNTACTFEIVFAGTYSGVNKHKSVCSVCDHVKPDLGLCLYKNGNTCTLCGTHKDVHSTAAAGESTKAE